MNRRAPLNAIFPMDFIESTTDCRDSAALQKIRFAVRESSIQVQSGPPFMQKPADDSSCLWPGSCCHGNVIASFAGA